MSFSSIDTLIKIGLPTASLILDGRFHPDIAAEARSKMLFPG